MAGEWGPEPGDGVWLPCLFLILALTILGVVITMRPGPGMRDGSRWKAT